MRTTGGCTDAFEQMLASEKGACVAALNKEEQHMQELHLLQVELRQCQVAY